MNSLRTFRYGSFSNLQNTPRTTLAEDSVPDGLPRCGRAKRSSILLSKRGYASGYSVETRTSILPIFTPVNRDKKAFGRLSKPSTTVSRDRNCPERTHWVASDRYSR